MLNIVILIIIKNNYYGNINKYTKKRCFTHKIVFTTVNKTKMAAALCR